MSSKRFMLGLLLCSTIFFGWLNVMLGCSTTIVPPAKPSNPVIIFLLDHGRTPSLVIPNPQDGTMIRYSYGDWRYYALRRNDLGHGLAALFWPTQATLGRQLMQGPFTAENVDAQAIVEIEHLYSFTVDCSKADEVRQRLERIYEDNRATEVTNEPYAMNFVHHPRPYTLVWTSNHAVADWIKQMGCEVRGPITVSNWKIRKPV